MMAVLRTEFLPRERRDTLTDRRLAEHPVLAPVHREPTDPERSDRLHARLRTVTLLAAVTLRSAVAVPGCPASAMTCPALGLSAGDVDELDPERRDRLHEPAKDPALLAHGHIAAIVPDKTLAGPAAAGTNPSALERFSSSRVVHVSRRGALHGSEDLVGHRTTNILSSPTTARIFMRMSSPRTPPWSFS